MTRILQILALSGACLAGAEPIDHAATIKGLHQADAKKGRALYALHCASCHGKDGDLATNPLARRFARDELKFGNDPYSLWKTISYGNGLMFRWDGVLSPQERYQIVHHLREEILKEKNPGQYSALNEDYFTGLNEQASADAEKQKKLTQRVQAAPGMIDGTGGTRMQYGPFLQHAVSYGSIADKNAPIIEETTEKALIIDLPGEQVICYDAARLSVSGIWKGKLANTEKTHHTSYKGSRPLTPGGSVLYKDIDRIGWTGPDLEDSKGTGQLTFHGLFLKGNEVLLSYRVGEREVLELPGANGKGGTITRTFEVGTGREAVNCLVNRGGQSALQVSLKVLQGGAELVLQDDGSEWLRIEPSTKPTRVIVFLTASAVVEKSTAHVPESLMSILRAGPRRWPVTVQTAIAPADPIEGYAADHLTVPLANPYGSWMRVSAMDFFSDGRMAVSTLSGDVWIVTPVAGAQALEWSRFAAGLYEPLGLRIVKDKVYVRGRDRITLLQDLNHDGEADRYESFFEDHREVGAGYHAFSYDLQSDDEGNFYFAQGGYKSPLDGGVIRVSPDGKSSEFVCTDMRNPNGLGSDGKRLTVADNPSGKALFDGFALVEEGGVYGFEKERSTPMLVVLPPKVDSSSGGQCWSRKEGWGPLSGSVIHTSYSLCAVFYCLIEEASPYPNGFALRFPYNLISGAMRPRVNPVDGQVYVACHKGWDSKAPIDGAIYRLRYSGGESHLVSGASVTHRGIRLAFACDLEAAAIVPRNVRWARSSLNKKDEAKPRPVPKVHRIDARTIEVEIPKIGEEALPKRTRIDKETGRKTVTVNAPIELHLNLKAADGVEIRQTIYATVNSVPER